MKRATMHNIKAFLDNDRVQRGNHGGGDAEADPDHGDLGPVKEDADEETCGDNGAGGKNP